MPIGQKNAMKTAMAIRLRPNPDLPCSSRARAATSATALASASPFSVSSASMPDRTTPRTLPPRRPCCRMSMTTVCRTSLNPISKQVKIHDLEDNMDIRRLSEVTEKDLARLNKYLRAYKYLTAES